MNLKVKFTEKGNPDLLDIKDQLVKSGYLKSKGQKLYMVDEEQRLLHVLPKKGSLELIKELKRHFMSPEDQRLLTNSDWRNLVDELLTEPCIEVDEAGLNHPEYVNVSNGVVDLKTGKLLAEDEYPKMYFDYVLDFSFSDDSNSPLHPENFINFLKNSRPEESDESFNQWQTALLEAIGYLLSGDPDIKKAVFFVGATRSGKSTLSELIARAILPKQRAKHYSFSLMAQNFSTINVATARLNISDELDVTTKKGIELFKTLASGGELSLPEKYGYDIDVLTNVKMLFCCNGFPSFRSADISAIADRLLVIDFQRTVPEGERTANPLASLLPEKNVIFTLALKAYIKAKKGGFTTLPTAQKLLDMMTADHQSIKSFLDENADFSDSNAKISAKRLYAAYIAYCDVNQLSAATKREFKAFILANYPSVEYKKIRDQRINSVSSVQGYEGLSFNEGNNHEG